MADVIFYVPLYVAMLFAAIAAHEYGHYLACRWLVIPVFGFNVGIGPEVKKWVNHHGMEIIIRAWPLAGEVRIMNLKERWSHAIVILAGPFANLLLGGVSLLILALIPEARGAETQTFTAWFLGAFGYLNLFICISNLAPCGKLDGGQLVMLAAKLKLGREDLQVFRKKYKALGMAPYWILLALLFTFY